MNLKKIFLMTLGFLASAVSKETFKEFLNDNRGGLVLSFGDNNFKDTDWIEYKLLRPDKSVKSINPNDLPEDFCEEACRLVDEFHRKTANQDVEWMLYFDYTTGEIIYCWKGEEGKAIGDYENIHVHGRNIASIHNHTLNYFSFPSPNNFDILGNIHEDYEIITSVNVFWIVEFKGRINENCRKKFQQSLGRDMDKIISIIRISNYINEIRVIEEVVGNYLLDELEKQIQGIDLVLIKMEYN